MTHIQQRRDLAANWTSANPILLAGEMGHETDTGKSKMGNGASAWVALPYRQDVHSVNGKTGDVVLGIEDIPEAAPIDSPEFTGAPTAPTPNWWDETTRVATTAMVTEVARRVLDMTHPIGSIYLSVNPASPAALFGGTWVRWGKGRVVTGVDEASSFFSEPEDTGGEISHTLTVEELPPHDHGGSTYVDTPDHSHGQNVTASAVPGPGVRADYSSDAASAIYPQGINTEGASVQHTHSIPSEGEGWEFNILQPFITCYMWKRTA